ncbi:MAG: hypothetical protein JW739_01610 [Opitutales bacterium]|nr:hypothetical protein [Opitutales bacterium]
MSSSSVDITALTASQIIEYSSRSSFSMATDAYDITSNHGAGLNTSTKTINETVGVISSLEEQLKTIQANLEQMYVAALSGAQASADSADKQDAYAQLRSLSAGIDQLTNSYKLDDTRVLAGQTFTFSSGNGTVSYKQGNLSSSLEGGLGLSEKQEGRMATLDIDYLAYMKNLSSSIYEGVEVSEASYTMPKNATAALDEGNYYVKVTYEGENSYVELTSLDGVVIESQDVDLTGVGSKAIQFGSGLNIDLKFDETDLASDYDWETDGGNELYYTVEIDETYEHVLKTESDGAVNSTTSASLSSYSNYMRGETGKLTFSVTAKDDDDQLDTGKYNMKVEYNGEKSAIWLYDSNGDLAGVQRGIDMTQDGETEVDMGNGLVVTIDNDDFTYNGKKTKNVGVDYTNGNAAYTDFDYATYAKQVYEAYQQVTNQLNLLYQADEAVTEKYQYLQQATSSSSTTSASVLAAQSISSLLSDLAIDTENNPFFASSDATASLSAAASSIFGSLESNYTTISDADYEVLARYY